MLYEYLSVLHPVYDVSETYDEATDLLSIPTELLRKEYARKMRILEKMRREEPSKKRGKKLLYRVWIMATHTERDRLNAIADELRRRVATEKLV